MKKVSFLFFILFFFGSTSFAQSGYINTIAGTGVSGFSGDGGPATAARMGQATVVYTDASGNIYIADPDNNRIRRIDPSGNINTYCGGGISLADGVPATTASIDVRPGSAMLTDAAGNLYFGENHRIRMIDAVTGIITTIAGGLTAGYSGDGGPATAAMFNYPIGICFDAGGNIYIGDQENHRVRKINTAGIISTIVGTGTSGFSGDGGPATAAQLNRPDGLCMDMAGNLYIADRDNFRIRKITPSGIISTIAGSGSGFSGDGGPATSAKFTGPTDIRMDSYGNFYVADWHNNRIRKIDTGGIISTVAGGGATVMGSGIPATSASLSDTWSIGIDGYDNFYITDHFHNRVCKINWTPAFSSSDSFVVKTMKLCDGPELNNYTKTFGPGMYIVTDFGDGVVDTTKISKGYSTGGYAKLTHSYNAKGSYTINQVLFNGVTPLDTFTQSYSYTFCRTVPVSFYYDANNSCIKEPVENNMLLPTVTEVDSNGVRIAIVSATSGFNYCAYGNPGDLYSFKVTSSPGNMITTCPSSGTWSHRLSTAVNPTVYIGYNCGTTPGFDLEENVSVRCGFHYAEANIIVSNKYCNPENATYTLHFSPKYAYGSASPTPVSVSGSTITWNMKALSSTMSSPAKIHVTFNASHLMIGDTVNSEHILDPTAGDINVLDNNCHRVDTIRSGFDPNELSVFPEGYIQSGTSLKYTIEFENTGNDTAHNVYVMDTLPDYVDVNSLRLAAASAVMTTTILNEGVYKIVRFDFPGINLLDSSHSMECHGMIIYNIKSMTGLADGTILPNHAGIFFDDNEAVLTNTTINIIGSPLAVPELTSSNNISLYPNPTTNEITIKTDNTGYRSFIVYNTIGQPMLQSEIKATQTKINVQTLPAGLYYVSIRGDNATKVLKFLKL